MSEPSKAAMGAARDAMSRLSSHRSRCSLRASRLHELWCRTDDRAHEIAERHEIKCGCDHWYDGHGFSDGCIQAAIAEAVERERERCVAMCHDYAVRANIKALHVQYDTAMFLAEALRKLP